MYEVGAAGGTKEEVAARLRWRCVELVLGLAEMQPVELPMHTWAAMLAIAAQPELPGGCAPRVFALFDEMDYAFAGTGEIPRASMYHDAVVACGESGDWRQALELWVAARDASQRIMDRTSSLQREAEELQRALKQTTRARQKLGPSGSAPVLPSLGTMDFRPATSMGLGRGRASGEYNDEKCFVASLPEPL